LKILFSPSESKNFLCEDKSFDENTFIFKDLFAYRMQALKEYENFVKTSDEQGLKDLFGIKEKTELDKFKQDLTKASTRKAIELYSGVGYEYLDFFNLKQEAKSYIYENVLIFSNLFGVVRAKDNLPFYKFKQGAKIKGFALESFYKKYFSKHLDSYLEKEELIDLRAGFYDKFYIPKRKFSTYKFIKNGKVVSHFAKAYRGILLNILAQNLIQSNEELLEKLPSNLKLKELKILGLKEEFTLEILDL